MHELVTAALLVASLGSGPTATSMPVQERAADEWLGADKFRHFWVSFAATSYTFGAATAAGGDADVSLGIAIPVAAVLGVGKEVHDRRRGQRFSVRDLVADALGITAASFLLREVR